MLKKCWSFDPKSRPTASHIVEFLKNHPRIVSPSLDVPQSAVAPEVLPEKSRKLSLALNNRLPQTAIGCRKRSMSGNMVINCPPLTSSLSEDAITHNNLEALNLNHVMIEETNETGRDPLLPSSHSQYPSAHSQYVSSRFMSLPHKDKEREKQCLMNKQLAGEEYCSAEFSREPWTNMTPV